jgi:hypothetical protein
VYRGVNPVSSLARRSHVPARVDIEDQRLVEARKLNHSVGALLLSARLGLGLGPGLGLGTPVRRDTYHALIDRVRLNICQRLRSDHAGTSDHAVRIQTDP